MPPPAPSPIPAYLTHSPSSSRSSSIKSGRSAHSHSHPHPHHQHREYIPNNNQSTAEPNASAGAAFAAILQDEYESDSDGSEIGEGMTDSITWTEMKDSHLSNKKWYRRPSPGWLYLFAVGATLSLGMSIAPKQELYISLACLAHPPKTDSTPPVDPGMGRPGGGWDRDHDGRTVPTMPISTKPMPSSLELKYSSTSEEAWIQAASNATQRSPFDEWFLNMQKEDWARRHPHIDIGDGLPDGNESDEEYKEIDPRLCKRDPNVQAAAAKFQMTMTLTMGILAALTTGFWGQQSDKIGRTRVMAIAEFGLFCSDLSFILVANFPHLVPGGYRFLLIGPVIDGSLGGIATLLATVNAYISDVTPDGSRARVYARFTGILMIGFAAGPFLGSFVIDRSGNILLPFYINICIEIFYVCGLLFVLPESTSKEARAMLFKTAQTAKATAKRNALLVSSRSSSVRKWFASWFGALEIFIPRKVEGQGRDWSLTCLAAAMFLMNMMMGVLGVKGQYLLYAYGWTSSELGKYLTLMGMSRGLALLVILPTLFYFFRPRPPAHATDASEQTPLIAAGGKTKHSIREARFDLIVVRISVLIEMIAYAAMSFAVSATAFTALTAMVTFGSGSAPASTSLALALLPSQRDAGKLFGGLAMVNALSSTLLGPLVFGSVFASTIGTYPTAVFAMSGIIMLIAQIVLFFVRIPGAVQQDQAEGRGRARGRKDLRTGLVTDEEV